MTDAAKYPNIKYVVRPVHLDSTLTGAKPRMRHNPGCGHFKWPDNAVLGTFEPATPEQMQTLRACKSCIKRLGC